MEIIEIRRDFFQRKIKVWDIIECNKILFLTKDIQENVLLGINFNDNKGYAMSLSDCKLFEGSILISN